MTRPNNGQDDLDPAVGIFYGMLVSACLWVLILWGVHAVVGCGQ